MILLNGLEVKPTIFPDGSSQVWKLENISSFENNIEYKYSKEIFAQDMIDLVQILYLVPNVKLYFEYLPYGRQDKLINNNSTFALSVFLRTILVSGNINTIFTYDAHNPNFTSSFIHGFNLNNKSPNQLISYQNILPMFDRLITEDTVIVFPDKGAETRYGGLIHDGVETVTVNKTRNQLTGGLSLEFLTSEQFLICRGKRLLMVDDLCDAGGTFILAAQKLKQASDNIELYTSHGLYSKGKQILLDAGIKKLYTKEDL